MSTVAFKGGCMAADSGVWDSQDCRFAEVRKLRKLANGWLLGGCGPFESVLLAMDYLTGHLMESDFSLEKPELEDDISILAAGPDGDVLLYEQNLYAMPLEGPFHAIGSGREGALCAMAAGASARDAIHIVSEFNAYTFGPVQSVDLDP